MGSEGMCFLSAKRGELRHGENSTRSLWLFLLYRLTDVHAASYTCDTARLHVNASLRCRVCGRQAGWLAYACPLLLAAVYRHAKYTCDCHACYFIILYKLFYYKHITYLCVCVYVKHAHMYISICVKHIYTCLWYMLHTYTHTYGMYTINSRLDQWRTPLKASLNSPWLCPGQEGHWTGRWGFCGGFTPCS